MSDVQVSGQPNDDDKEIQVEENVKPEPKRRGPNKPKPVEVEVDETPEPRLGRTVHYVTRSGTIRPAVITAILPGGVDLTVFNSSGAVPVNGVFIDAETPGETPGTAFWPEGK